MLPWRHKTTHSELVTWRFQTSDRIYTIQSVRQINLAISIAVQSAGRWSANIGDFCASMRYGGSAPITPVVLLTRQTDDDVLQSRNDELECAFSRTNQLMFSRLIDLSHVTSEYVRYTIELAIKEGVWRAVQQRLRTEWTRGGGGGRPGTRACVPGTTRAVLLGVTPYLPEHRCPRGPGQWDDRDAGNGRPRA